MADVNLNVIESLQCVTQLYMVTTSLEVIKANELTNNMIIIVHLFF